MEDIYAIIILPFSIVILPYDVDICTNFGVIFVSRPADGSTLGDVN